MDKKKFIEDFDKYVTRIIIDKFIEMIQLLL
jgi:hypothetical protein